VSDWAAPRRVRLVALVLVLGAVGFAVTGVVRMFVDASPGGKADMVTLPLALLVADLIIAGALVTGWYSVRPVAQGLAIFGALVHVLVLLRSGGWWIRGWSALLSVAHVYALLLFFAFTAEERDDELDELEDEDELDGERSRPTASAGVLVPAQAGPPEIPPAEPVETPVEQLVDAPDPARAEGSAGPEPAGEAPAGTPTADESAPVPDSADEWPAEKAASEEKAVGEEKARNPGPTVEDANTDDSTEATPGDGTGSAERVEVAAGRRGGSDRSDEDTTEGTA
jgi:hypothetical protein